MRSRWSILISIATLCLAGCSTHDAKFDSVLAPVSPSPVAGVSFLQNAAGGLLLRYANHESALSTESLALLAQASADGYIAIRDSWKARAAYLVQTARGFASVLERRRVPLDGGRAFTVGTRRRTGDPMVSAIAGDAFVDVFLATGGHSYAAAASAIVRALMGSTKLWLRSRAAGGGAAAVSATVALFLERAADIDISASSTGLPPSAPDHKEIRAERADARQADAEVAGTLAVRALAGGAVAGASSDARSGLARLAMTLIALTAPATAVDNPNVASVATPDLAIINTVFSAAGRPAAGPATNASRASGCIVLAALAPGSALLRQAMEWALNHRRTDGTLPLAADSDPVGQAFCLVAIEREVSLLLRAVLPQP